MLKIHTSFKARYEERTDKVFSCTATIQPHSVIVLIIILMMMVIIDDDADDGVRKNLMVIFPVKAKSKENNVYLKSKRKNLYIRINDIKMFVFMRGSDKEM